MVSVEVNNEIHNNQLWNELSCHQDNQEDMVTETLLSPFADFWNARTGRSLEFNYVSISQIEIHRD
jgi:hypothetical protein